MKKQLLLVLLMLHCNKFFAATQHLRWQTIEINKNQIHTEVAETNEALQTGLMGRTTLPANQGMLFVIRTQNPITFWMYHTLIPLDMLFIKDRKIIKISQHVPPCRSENALDCEVYPDSQGIRVDEVLEVNAGYVQTHHIQVGDSVTLIKE